MLKIIGINLIVFLTLLVVAFIPMEIYTRSDDARENSNRQGAYTHWKASYPHIKNEIYALKPGSYSRRVGEVEESFRINEAGYRELNFDPQKKVDVIFYGDSFTFGHGAKQGERFTDLVTLENKHLNIANFAYNGGFTAPHYLLHFRLNNHAPSKVFVFSYLGNDCQADLNESVLLSPEEGGYPTRIITPEGYLTGDRSDYPWVVQFASAHSHFLKQIFARVYSSKYGSYFFSVRARPNTPNTKAFDNGTDETACHSAFQYLKELEKQCKARNPACKLVNFLVPQDFFVYNMESQANHTGLSRDEQIKAFENPRLFTNVMAVCSRLGLHCVDLLPVFKGQRKEGLYLKSDAHWSPSGNRLVATQVEGLLRD